MFSSHLQDDISEFLGGVLSQGALVQESVIVDMTDIDTRKRVKPPTTQPTDELDGVDYLMKSAVCILLVSLSLRNNESKTY